MRIPRALARAFRAVLALAALASSAFAADATSPIPFSFQVTDCNDLLRSANSTNINNPRVRVQVQDGESGLRIGNTPLATDNMTRTDTILFMEMNGGLVDTSKSGTPAVSNHNHGFLHGDPTFVAVDGVLPAAFDRALNLAGTNSNGTTVNGVTVYRATNSFTNPNRINQSAARMTVEAWVRRDDGVSRPFVEWSSTFTATGARRDGPHIWINRGMDGANSAGTVYVNWVSSFSGGGIQDFVSTAAAVLANAGQYYLLAVTFDSSPPGMLAIHVDGVLRSSRTLPNFGLMRVDSDMSFRIGYSSAAYPGSPDTGIPGFLGRIDQLRVLHRALLTNELARDFSGSQLLIRRPGPSNSTHSFAPDIVDGQKTLVTYTKRIGTDLNPVLNLGDNSIDYLFQDKTGNTAESVNTLTFARNAPGPPTITAFTALSDSSIQYTWTQPTGICTGTAPQYDVSDCNGVQVAGLAGLTATTNTETVPGPNARVGRRVAARDMQLGDIKGSSSTCVEAYTRARQPLSLTASEVTTTTIRLTWNTAGNPANTRYEISIQGGVAGCTAGTPCVVKTIGDNFVTDTHKFTSLTPGETYTYGVRAFNGFSSDFEVGGQHFTGYALVTQATIVTSTTLSVAAVADANSLAWSWPAVFGAATYTLRDDASNVLCGPIGATNCVSGPHGPNAPIRARVTATGTAGDGDPSPFARAFTTAKPPANFRVRAGSVSSNTVTLDWDLAAAAPLNPSYTNFEIRRASNAAISGLVSTVTVGGTSTPFTNLFPLTSYYFQIRAINGDDLRSAADAAIPVAFTNGSANVSSSTGPYSTYESLPDAIGIWHFDESTGTLANDASGNSHNGRLLCDFNRCISTPTYSAGGAGLGTAIRTVGQSDSYVAVTTSTRWDWPGGSTGLTLEAWVNPSQTIQTPDATVVAKGSSSVSTDFAFSLDVYFTGPLYRYRFRVGNGASVSTLNTATQLEPGTWRHLAAVWLPGSSEMRFYVDGVFVSSGAAITSRQTGGRATIGSRPLSGTSSYNAGFNGLIDEVKVINRALSAAQVQAEYDAGRPGLFVPTTGNADVRLTIPPNAFSGAVQVYVSANPLENRLQVSPSHLNSGLTSPPTGQTLVPGSLLEIVTLVNGLPFTGTLGSSVTVSVSYPDADGNGLIDGTFPPVQASRLTMYTLKNQVPEWEALTTTVDTTNRRVLGSASHFSIFALFGPSGIGADLSGITVFPVPWKPGSKGKFDSAVCNGRTGLCFTQLPQDGVLKIFSFGGELVIELPFTAVDAGTVVWDGRNHAGRNVASGVYFARVRATAGGASLLKFAIER